MINVRADSETFLLTKFANHSWPVFAPKVFSLCVWGCGKCQNLWVWRVCSNWTTRLCAWGVLWKTSDLQPSILAPSDLAPVSNHMQLLFLPVIEDRFAEIANSGGHCPPLSSVLPVTLNYQQVCIRDTPPTPSSQQCFLWLFSTQSVQLSVQGDPEMWCQFFDTIAV